MDVLDSKLNAECTTLGTLQPGTILLVTEGTARAMRNFELEERDAAIWDGKTLVHLATNTRLLVDPGVFVFKDPDTEAWTI